MNGFTSLALALLVFASSDILADEPSAIQRWDRVVSLQSENENKPGTAQQCSAFLVNTHNKLFLVTAGHASEETHRKSRLVYRDPSGESQWVWFNVLFPEKSNPWCRYKNSDLAVAQVKPQPDGQVYFSDLMAVSIPLQRVSTEAQMRTTKIDVGGFPLGLGVKDPVSPVAVVGHIASGEIDTDNRWGNEPIIYCTPALAQGTSGGPAFLANESPNSVTVVGMYIGVVLDVSGAKLSKLIPSRLIHDAISTIHEPQSGE